MRTIEAPTGTLVVPENNGTLQAQGIPYARAQRFHHPEPVLASDFAQPYIANTPAPAAPQHLRGKDGDIRQSVLMSEDCQNLTVVAPTDTFPGERLPVMVYLHGGSYVVGSGDGARYNPERLVLDERVVVVRVTFRLGLLGFMGGTAERPANLGLLDVREALRWVKINISSFGGNPENVTVFGQSAGGDLATQLILAEGVIDEGLLHRVISQSAPLELVNDKEKITAHVMKKTAAIAADAEADVFGDAAWKNVYLNPAQFGFYPSMMPFGTQYGHYPLPAPDDVDAAWKKAAPHVDVLVGANLREAAYFIPRPPRWAGSAILAAEEKLVRKGARDLYLEPARRFVKRHRSAGGNGTSYSLAVGHPLHWLYSAHCTELALLFDNPAWENSKLLAGSHAAERARQGSALRAIWAGFARDGVVRKDLADRARITFR